ncbi:hypothetical protein DH2020_016301 [Rehmannia glutinosa]|uniref:DYW domain-containing protein n=1 Tax=Rehmannia glutinosa TaxID=99300 RepID=A0ABR0WMK3_REHGL
MYTRRAALVTFKSLGPLIKVCRTRAPEFPCSVGTSGFVRNFRTATERSDLYSNLDGNSLENQAGESGYNQNGRFYDRNLGGVEQNINPSGVYGQTLNGQYGNFITERSDSPTDNAENRSEYNSGNQNSGFHNPNGIYGQNFDMQHGNFAGQSNFGGSYGGSVNSPGMYQQSVAGNYYNNEGNYQLNWSESQSDRINLNQIPNDMNPNVASVEGSQFRSKPEDLDEFTKEGKLKEAVELLGQLQNEGTQIDLPRYMALMKACGENEALDEAKSVHEHLLNSGAHLEVKTYNQILEMYYKCGSMKDAFAVFDQMPKRNLTSWDIMISWLAKNGFGEDSIELFAEFKNSGLKPDGQMFTGVFSACGVLCDIVEGLLHFESMTKDYGIVPTMEHYVSMVGMLGNAGCLDEALEFIENLPVEPSIEIWETLMKFSRIHGNMELGDRCAELVQLLDPSRLNEQSRAGLIPINASDLAREKEKKKLSGQNLLDVRSRVHEYRAGDRSHPDNERIYTLLRGLKQQMKEVGYIPETKFVLHDVDQEVKEEALMAHSERLAAAAQGFLTSAARSPLRIIKNLRVCGDCHNAFKIISKIVGREIIARDSKRFHHFRDGSCSCNDYW